VLIATGASKARAIQRMRTERITTAVPASFLQLHANVQLVVDRAAAGKVRQV
jgi:glucosamine-6-phosphate deaminase